MNTLDRLVQNPLGALAVLTLAAFLEAWGDSFFQAGFYRSSGFGRVLALLAGAAVLAAYGSVAGHLRGAVLPYGPDSEQGPLRAGAYDSNMVGRRAHRSRRPGDRILEGMSLKKRRLAPHNGNRQPI